MGLKMQPPQHNTFYIYFFERHYMQIIAYGLDENKTTKTSHI